MKKKIIEITLLVCLLLSLTVYVKAQYNNHAFYDPNKEQNVKSWSDNSGTVEIKKPEMQNSDSDVNVEDVVKTENVIDEYNENDSTTTDEQEPDIENDVHENDSETSVDTTINTENSVENSDSSATPPNIQPESSGMTEVDKENIKVEKINAENYKPYISYGEMSKEARVIVSRFFELIGKDHGANNIISIQTGVQKSVLMEVKTFLTLYYGDFYKVRKELLLCYRETDAVDTAYDVCIDLTVLPELELKRKRYICLVEDTLRNMNEGSETEKLMQVARWIAKQYTYKADSGSVGDFWDGKRVSCTVASMVFRMFCERLGIPCDIVVGYADINGEYHAWNRVKLSDGTYRYYDIVLYKNYGSRYLNATNQLGKQVYINRYID